MRGPRHTRINQVAVGMYQDTVECQDIRSDLEKRTGCPPRYTAYRPIRPAHPMAVSFTDIKGDSPSTKIHPSPARLIGYPAMTTLAKGEEGAGRFSDREIARMISAGDPRATLRLTADPAQRMAFPADDRSRGRFSADAKAAPTAGDLAHDLNTRLRAKGADAQATRAQIRQGLLTAFAPLIDADGNQPDALKQMLRICEAASWPAAKDIEYPSFL